MLAYDRSAPVKSTPSRRLRRELVRFAPEKSAPTNVGEAVGAWAAEAADYDHGTNACSGFTCGHYTQMVWADTRYLGCGVAACPSGGEMWVCNYDPRGNVLGKSPY